MTKKGKTNTNMVLQQKNYEKLTEGFNLVTPYRTVLDKVTAVCKDCGYEDTKTARTFIRSGCTNCRKEERLANRLLAIRESDDAYLDRINEDNEEYEIVKYREYEDDVLEVKHVPCGQIERIENRYVKAICIDCNPDKLIDADWYRELHPKLVRDGYKVKRVIYSDYTPSKSRSTSLELYHEKCGNTFTRINHTLKTEDGYLCPICHRGAKRIGEITEDNIDQIVKSIVGDEYEYISGYTSSSEPFYIRHLTCGTISKKRLSALRGTGEGCIKCSKIKRIVNRELSKRLGKVRSNVKFK